MRQGLEHGQEEPDKQHWIFVEGAPETVLRLCGEESRIAELKGAAEKGLRVLAVAQTDWDQPYLEDPSGYPFRFLGFVALADPIRPSVPSAVAQCRRIFEAAGHLLSKFLRRCFAAAKLPQFVPKRWLPPFHGL